MPQITFTVIVDWRLNIFKKFFLKLINEIKDLFYHSYQIS